MEKIIFLLMILGGLYWLIRRINNYRPPESTRRPAAARRNYTASAASTSVHATPGNNLLADNEKIWNARRQHARHMGSEATGSSAVPGFEEEPAYDGYSRRDRRHLSPAHIEEEHHIDGLTMPHIEYQPAESQEAAKRE